MDNNKDKEQKPYNRNDAISAFMQDAPARDKGVLGHVRDASLSFLADGALGAGEALVGLANIPTRGQAGKLLQDTLGYDAKAAHEFIGDLKTDKYKEQKKEFQANWERAFGGVENTGRSVFTGSDVDFVPLTSNNRDSQFVEQRKLQVEEICRCWNVNPLFVFSDENGSSYNAREQAVIQHLTFTMAPWYRMIEEVRAMLICPRGETADAVIHGVAVFIIIIIRVARCNDRIRRPIPGTALM